jgi:periplasmic protein TonB
MSATLIDASGLFWAYAEEDERRFRRILLRVAALFTVLSVAMPWLPVPELLRHTLPPPPPPQVRLILPPKPPAPVVRPVQPQIKPTPRVAKAASKPVIKPTPAKPVRTVVAAAHRPVEDARAARAKAARSGLLAFKDALADLRDQPVVASVNTRTHHVDSGGTAASAERSLITSDLARGSGGINTASLSRDTGGSGLAGHATTRVRSTLGAGGGSTASNASASGTGRIAGRSIEEIQTIFDRNKGAIYAIYNRALRSDPTLQGKVVLKLTITPSGRVSVCRVVSSDLHAAELERKLTGRVMLFDFGAKDVGELTITYPLDFLPA